MPADHKVKVPWQIVATFVPIANFWAFYGIRKLQKYLLYAYVPALLISIALAVYISLAGLWVVRPDTKDYFLPPVFWASYAISAGLQILAIYLVVK